MEARIAAMQKADAVEGSAYERRIAALAHQVQQLTAEGDQFNTRLNVVSQEMTGVTAQSDSVTAERDQLQARLSAPATEMAAAQTQIAELTAKQAAPMAMAAAAGAAVSAPQVPVADPPVTDSWEPKYQDMQSRFHSFVVTQQKEG